MLNRTTQAEQPQIATRLAALYPCSAKRHAVWTPDKKVIKDERGKVKVAYRDVDAPVSDKEWLEHVKGKCALVPIIACDNGTSKSMWLDIDIYGADIFGPLFSRLEVNAKGFPLYIRPSKSAVHIGGFFKTAIPAEDAQLAARGIVKKLKLDGVFCHPTSDGPFEFFPKPNFCLNMPYLGGHDNGFVRQVMTKEGREQIPLEEFLDNVQFLDEKQTAALIKLGKSVKDSRRTGNSQRRRRPVRAAPCSSNTRPRSWRCRRVRAIAPVRDAFQMGTMTIRIADGPPSRSQDQTAGRHRCAGWKDEAKTPDTLNRGLKEGHAVPHGPIGGEEPVIKIRKILSEPPIWFVSADQSEEVKIDRIENLMRFQRFNEQCAAQRGIVLPLIKAAVWNAIMRVALAVAETGAKPPDLELEPEGIFRENLETFLVNRQKGTKLEDVLSGRPFEDEDQQRHVFRLQDLTKFLEREGMRGVKRTDVQKSIQIWAGAGSNDPITMKGGQSRLWQVPSAVIGKVQPLPTPRMAGASAI